jgi:hypothetical protein
MENGFRNVALTALWVGLLCCLLPVALVLLVDPDHIFHKSLPWLPWHKFDTYAEVQNAGLINSYLADRKEGIDAILIGSSVSENFRPEYLTQKTGWHRVMKLTVPGADPEMQHRVVSRAIATGNVKHVFWEIFSNRYSYASQEDFMMMAKLYREGVRGHETAYLYNASRLDDYRYVLNAYSLSSSWKLLLGDPVGYTDSIDRIRYWGDECYRNRTCLAFVSKNNLEKIQSGYVYRKRPLSYAHGAPVPIDYFMLDQFLLQDVNAYCHQGISFDLYFPPVSLLWYGSFSEEEFDYHFYMPRHVVDAVAGCQNVRVFAFNNDAAMTGDLSHYHDPFHYRAELNDTVSDAFASGAYVIDRSNIAAYEEAMLRNVNEYAPHASVLQGAENPANYSRGDGH